MIIKCTNCGGRVKFNIEKQLCVCDSCNMLMENIQTENTEYTFDKYQCSSCGGKLNVNKGETTSVCPYCGTQSIVFNGSCNDFNIDYIIPFKITYDNAVNLIKNGFKTCKYIPKKLKRLHIENVRPLYVPYALYDIHMDTTQVIEGHVSENPRNYFIEYTRGIAIDYDEVEVIMTSRLPKELVAELEPWYFNEKRDFNPAYLAGMYALDANMYEKNTQYSVVEKTKEFINQTVLDSCYNTINKCIKSQYDYEITNKKTILLPIWIFSSSYKGENFSVVVNGQTGHIISVAPNSKSSFWWRALANITFIEFIIVMLGIVTSKIADTSVYDMMRMFYYFALLIYCVITPAVQNKYLEYTEKTESLNSINIINLSKEK